jgi:prepilin-type N-terminal cleavage/methylation domain-containing protein
MQKKDPAFTLIELTLVIVVVASLAAIAMPLYNKTKQRMVQKEGLVNLKLIATGEIVGRMRLGDYVDCSCSSAATCTGASGCSSLLKVVLNTQNWSYSVATAGSTGSKTATITATAKTGNCTYTLANADFDTKDFSSSAGCI